MGNPLQSPFRGVTVLDLSQGIAGPYCTAILAEQGARVIKVEPPGGDWSRRMGAAFGNQTTTYTTFNVGKQSICIDAGNPEGAALIRQLAVNCDLVVQNFRPGVVERLGLDYARLAAEVPGILYISISGFGSEGPEARRPATDSVMQASTGLMHLNADGGVPRKIPLPIADIATAIYAAQAAAAALYRRAISGQSGHIEISLLQACAAVQAWPIIESHAHPDLAGLAPSAPNGVFATADGHISLSCLDDAMFARICQALGMPQWASNQIWNTPAGRLQDIAELNHSVEQITRTRLTAHWTAALRQHDVLHSPVRTLADFLTAPQTQATGIFATLTQPGYGSYSFPHHPLGDLQQLGPAPGCGAQSAEVLLAAGLTAAEIDRLLVAGIIQGS
ncbi:MAG: CaiB/BaiF CoA transferase family protein [Jhaorihella sp.]